jgi:hypothetical protein
MLRLLMMQGPVPTKHLNMGTALKLFGLSSIEVVRGKQYDSKALIAAGGNTIVVAFRGTASTSAALADLQVSVCLQRFVCLLFAQRPLGTSVVAFSNSSPTALIMLVLLD